jgi:putative FMN-binding protein
MRAALGALKVMYNPPHFREEREEVLHAVMRENPLAIIVTMGASGMIASLLHYADPSGVAALCSKDCKYSSHQVR